MGVFTKIAAAPLGKVSNRLHASERPPIKTAATVAQDIETASARAFIGPTS